MEPFQSHDGIVEREAPRPLVWVVRVFGATCCLIALSHIVLGPAAVPGAIPVNATLDSEDRFYATLFLGFGAALVWTSGELRARSGVLCALLAVFCLAGMARVISMVAVGLPHPLFVVLCAVEILLPPALWFWVKSSIDQPQRSDRASGHPRVAARRRRDRTMSRWKGAMSRR